MPPPFPRTFSGPLAQRVHSSGRVALLPFPGPDEPGVAKTAMKSTAVKAQAKAKAKAKAKQQAKAKAKQQAEANAAMVMAQVKANATAKGKAAAAVCVDSSSEDSSYDSDASTMTFTRGGDPNPDGNRAWCVQCGADWWTTAEWPKVDHKCATCPQSPVCEHCLDKNRRCPDCQRWEAASGSLSV